LTTLILKDFLDTPYFHTTMETLKTAATGDIVTLKLKNNTGGDADLRDLLIITLSTCRAKVNLVAEGRVISAAAYVWMYLNTKLTRHPL
jgi:predicted TIM-barrel enzyme